MKTICFYFQVHQPFRLKKYRFFEIGEDHYYYDDFANKSILQKVAQKCYLPMNSLLLDLIKEYGSRFKVSFSISGVAIEQFELYAPEVLESFKKLAKTGNVEFLAETYSHSLSALKSREEFERQVNLQVAKVEEHFGQTPVTFRNTELIYSDEIGKIVADMGYKAMLTEGAKQILAWKSPNYVYYNALNPKLKVLLKNYTMSDDIAFRFSNRAWEEWPLTAEKYVDWLNNIPEKEEVVNLFMDYETFGEHQWAETGIFDFMRALPKYIFEKSNYEFLTPSEVAQKLQPVAAYNVPNPISWADEERDLTAWLGNEMQDEAFDKLYALEEKIRKIDDADIQKDWLRLQTSDHFYYMCTKFFSDGDVHMYFNPYDNPYNAFINYMNILSDFTIRVNNAITNELGDQIPKTESEILELIEKYKREIKKLEQKLSKLKTEKKIVKTVPKKTSTVRKATATKKKTTTKKSTTTRKKTATKKSDTKKTTENKKNSNKKTK